MQKECRVRSAECGVAILTVLLSTNFCRAAVTSLDDIHFWVGSGSNRAGFVLDWNGDSTADGSLVWGYRWDGEANGEAMLRAVIAADPRLYAKLGEHVPYGVAVRGLGHDLNDDGEFAIDDATEFDADGVAQSGPTDGAMSLDATDRYREGWQIGVWNYGVANANPWPNGAWTYSPLGGTDRMLVDGAWDSWAFTATFRPTAFAMNPSPATQPADFDSDSDVDGADFLAWQRGVGLIEGVVRSAGDATGDGAIDGVDLLAWRSQFRGISSGGPVVAAPEPHSLITCASALFVVFRRSLLRRRKVS
jgi:hypothetical protein